jgi:hypothetical protein
MCTGPSRPSCIANYIPTHLGLEEYTEIPLSALLKL